jgi:hypothetical protein
MLVLRRGALARALTRFRADIADLLDTDVRAPRRIDPRIRWSTKNHRASSEIFRGIVERKKYPIEFRREAVLAHAWLARPSHSVVSASLASERRYDFLRPYPLVVAMRDSFLMRRRTTEAWWRRAMRDREER